MNDNESNMMKEFKENTNYEIGLISNKNKKENPQFVKDSERLIRKGDFYIEKGIFNTADYFRLNPDNLPQKNYTIYELDDVTGNRVYFDEGTIEKQSGLLGDNVAPPPPPPLPKENAIPVDFQKMLNEAIAKNDELNKQYLASQADSYQKLMYEKDNSITELKNQIQNISTASNTVNPFIQEQLEKKEEELDDLKNDYRQLQANYTKLSLESASEKNQMQIQLDLMKKELIYKEKEDATFNEHQEVINQKQKEIDELAQKPKGLSGLFDKFDGETINVLAREIVPQLGKLISMGIDRLTGGAVPQAQYPAQPAPVQEVYNPDEYYEENVQQPQKPAYNPNLSGPGI